MCDPITIAGIALTAGSTVMNSMAQSKVASARSSVLKKERERQRSFDAEIASRNTTSQDRYQDFGGQQAQRSEKLGDYLTAAANDPNTQAQTTGSTPTVTGLAARELAKQKAKANVYNQQQGGALGDLRAFGDLLGGISREQARDAGQIATLGGFKTGSSNIVPYELEAANQKGAGLRTLADVMKLGGMVGTGVGLMGAGSGPMVLGGSSGAVGPLGAVSPFQRFPPGPMGIY